MTFFKQLWVLAVFEEVDVDAQLPVALLDLVKLVLVCHLVDALLHELTLALHAEITRPKDQRVDL